MLPDGTVLCTTLQDKVWLVLRLCCSRREKESQLVADSGLAFVGAVTLSGTAHLPSELSRALVAVGPCIREDNVPHKLIVETGEDTSWDPIDPVSDIGPFPAPAVGVFKMIFLCLLPSPHNNNIK